VILSLRVFGDGEEREESEGNMEIYLSLGVAVAGAFIYGFAQNPKLAELGRLAFWCGLLAFLLNFGQHSVNTLGK
jgi:hypothetical protein